MDELDDILKRLMKRHAKALPSGGEACIPEELFSDYLTDSLDPVEKEKIEKHFLACEICFQKSIIFSRVITEMGKSAQLEVPRDLKERTKMLARQAAARDMAEIVIEFGRDMVKIIKDSAGICTVPAPAVLNARAGRDRERSNPVAQISTTFHGIAADIFVEKTGDAEFEIEARMSDAASGRQLNAIRVNLVSGGKELASFLTEKGSALFQKLTFDAYVVKIYKGKDFIGSVPVTLAAAS